MQPSYFLFKNCYNCYLKAARRPPRGPLLSMVRPWRASSWALVAFEPLLCNSSAQLSRSQRPAKHCYRETNLLNCLRKTNQERQPLSKT